MAYPVLAFTAEQIDEIKAAARHVPHHLRGDYLEAVAAALTGRDFGDGDVHRAIVRASVRIMGIMRRDSEHSRSRRKHPRGCDGHHEMSDLGAVCERVHRVCREG
jgi:hypothetical protein